MVLRNTSAGHNCCIDFAGLKVDFAASSSPDCPWRQGDTDLLRMDFSPASDKHFRCLVPHEMLSAKLIAYKHR